MKSFSCGVRERWRCLSHPFFDSVFGSSCDIEGIQFRAKGRAFALFLVWEKVRRLKPSVKSFQNSRGHSFQKDLNHQFECFLVISLQYLELDPAMKKDHKPRSPIDIECPQPQWSK
ncbi:hypothetical protein BHM03_00029504 [Ensete ventricosum]|nr:hypothetical protein BHM03_00029504 [Ensete ventricosum]